METEGIVATTILILILILTLAVRVMPASSKKLHCSFRRLRLMRLMIRPPFVRCQYWNVSNRCLVHGHIFMPMESILELQETKRPQHAPKKPKQHQLLCSKEVYIYIQLDNFCLPLEMKKAALVIKAPLVNWLVARFTERTCFVRVEAFKIQNHKILSQ